MGRRPDLQTGLECFGEVVDMLTTFVVTVSQV